MIHTAATLNGTAYAQVKQTAIPFVNHKNLLKVALKLILYLDAIILHAKIQFVHMILSVVIINGTVYA